MTTREQIPMKPAAAASPARVEKAAPFGTLQRQCACGGSGSSGEECPECKKKTLQRSSRATGVSPVPGHGQGPDASGQVGHGTVPPIVHDVLHSPGEPLDAATRGFFEPRFGHDFSRVRLHTDSAAAESASRVNALAYTVGHHIAFDRGQYAPGTETGRHLLAHELTHVVQQEGAARAGLTGAVTLGAAEDAAEREASTLAPMVTRLPLGRTVGGLHATSQILRRVIRTNEPAGGCALCRSASVAGTWAHGIVQRQFRNRYGKNIIPEVSYPNPSDEENGRLDLLRVDRSHTPAIVEIGEIKPDNDRGVQAGRRDLGYYQTQLAQHFPGPEFAVEFLDVEPPGAVTVHATPRCPAQTMSVRAAKIGGPPGLYLFKCDPPARQIDSSCCRPESTRSEQGTGQEQKPPEPTTQGAAQTQPSEAAQRRAQAIRVVDDLITRLGNQIDRAEKDHKTQRDVIFKPSATGLVGFWTNRLFNTDPPDMTIWANADSYVGAAKRALREGKLGYAYISMLRARHAFLAALKKYVTWKEGIEGAASRMKDAIGAGAVLAVTVFVAPTVIAALAEGASATGGSAAAAEQLSVRIATTLAEADRVMETAEAVSAEQEIQAEAQLEAEMATW